MAGLKEVAQEAGVSVETVSRVLKGKYKGRTEKSRAVMDLVLRTADSLNYRPHTAARATRTNRSGLVGIIAEEASFLTHPVFTETLKGLNESLEKAGYIITITSLAGITESTLSKRIFSEQVLDGIFIIGNILSKQIKAIQKRIPACVLINTNSCSGQVAVRRDEYDAGITAGRELAGLGYRRALYFEVPVDGNTDVHYSISDRKQGFLSGFCKGKTEILSLHTGDIYAYLRKHISEITRDTVLVAGHNLRLFRLTSALSRLPLCAGEDFGLASLDDETGLLSSFDEVSRITFPRMEIGACAGSMMVLLLNGHRKECKSKEFKGRWLCRETTPRVNMV